MPINSGQQTIPFPMRRPGNIASLPREDRPSLGSGERYDAARDRIDYGQCGKILALAE